MDLTKDQIAYPVIPYDVILQNGQWKFDASTIYIYPKKVLAASGYAFKSDSSFYNDVVGENENFIVKKTSSTGIAPQNTVTPKSWLTYSFNSVSVDIWSTSGYTVNVAPGPNGYPNDQYNFVLVELLTRTSLGFTLVDSRTTSAFNPSVVSFYQTNEYYRISAGNFNYPSQTGTFTITY